MRSASLEGQIIQWNGSGICIAPPGASELCARCYSSFCPSVSADRVTQLCSSFCGRQVTSQATIIPAFSRSSAFRLSSRGTMSLPAVLSRSSASPFFGFSSRTPSPVCGNGICEATEAQYCPRDCPGLVSSPRSSSSPSNNPLNLTCNEPLPTGNDPCSTCVKYICPVRTETEMITICTSTCQLYGSRSSRITSSSRSSSAVHSSSAPGEPGGSYIELKTSNPQQFQTSGDGWISYGITRMHLNTIHPSGAQATATWQAQLPFGTYEVFMYWPHDRDASERYLMDSVPMYLTIGSSNHSVVVNQRTAAPAFSKIIGGYGPETVAHNWYRIGSFSATKQGGMEVPQSLRLTLPTGRASDSVKHAADGWVAAGDVRIYYKTPGITCGDGKCHESERDSCPIDCEGVDQCGNGYCDLYLGETLQTCVQDCGAPGVCGNLRCEPYAGENISNCRSDCQTMVGTTGGDGGGDEGGDTSGSGGETGGADGPDCGNGKCEEGETINTCPGDCPRSSSSKSSTRPPPPPPPKSSSKPASSRALSSSSAHICGDNICSKGETYQTCDRDCDPFCGDNICSFTDENTVTCINDCGVCGDGYCASDETIRNCPGDCSVSSGSSRSSSRASSKASSQGICTLVDKYGRTCTDTDCGLNTATAGEVTLTTVPGSWAAGGTFTDFCVGSNHVSEYHCVFDPQSTQYNGSTYYVGQTTAYCNTGCAGGKCAQGPVGSDTRQPDTDAQLENMEDEAVNDVIYQPDQPEPVIDVQVEFDQPFVPVGPSCGNADGAGFLCGMCLRSFCPFGNDRANTLCGFYCSADASLLLTADLTAPASFPSSVLPASQNNLKAAFFVLLYLLRLL